FSFEERRDICQLEQVVYSFEVRERTTQPTVVFVVARMLRSLLDFPSTLSFFASFYTSDPAFTVLVFRAWQSCSYHFYENDKSIQLMEDRLTWKDRCLVLKHVALAT